MEIIVIVIPIYIATSESAPKPTVQKIGNSVSENKIL